MSSAISSTAETAREQHRNPDGTFGAQPAAEADVQVDGTDPAAAELLGDTSWAPSRFGQTVTVKGPVLFLGAAVPEGHTDDPEYLDDRFHRAQAFFEERYGARLEPGQDRYVEDATVSWEVEHEDATDEEHAELEAVTRARLAGPGGGAARLAADLEEGPDGRTVMSAGLDAHMAATDEEARTPRDVVLTGEEDFWPHRTVSFGQADLDRAVSTARQHNDIARRVRRVGARNGSIIAQTYTGTGGTGRLAVYDADAWTPPRSQPMLPWSPPRATPVAKVDQDGHASLLTGTDALCRDCGQPLDDMASANVKGCCLACTGEWEDDRP